MSTLTMDASDALPATPDDDAPDADLLRQLKSWTSAISTVRELRLDLPPLDAARYWDEATETTG